MSGAMGDVMARLLALSADQVVAVTVVAIVMLWLAWVASYGWRRGTGAALSRAAWTAPLLLALYPRHDTEELPGSVAQTPLHVLLDDSVSMAGPPTAKVNALVERLSRDCVRLGCLPKVVRLSELSPAVRQGYTPLAVGLQGFGYRIGADPWLVITDGADERPSQAWPASLKGMGAPLAKGQEPRGLIIGVAPGPRENIFVSHVQAPPFAFADKPITVDVTLGREQRDRGGSAELVQLQVLAGETLLATANASFAAAAGEAQVQLTLPPLARGRHLLTVRALPTAHETELWDNVAHVSTEVLANTVGVLHLLGSPSWDGRFLRRYLKGEPKYDLISFFILRDPWDSQLVNERELSLIPFPVERLFREELPNFRVVVIQNFTMFQFLLPEYQANLVKFVKDGGGLLFVGGPRALTGADLSSTPLKEILPFDVKDGGGSLGGFGLGPPGMLPLAGMEGEGDEPEMPGSGPAYDPEVGFDVELASPEGSKRALANVYDDWEGLGDALRGFHSGRGLHRLDRVKLKAEASTVLLSAKVTKVPKHAAGLAAGMRLPLAVASYPGKGRALWLFSDSLWRLALTPSEQTSRQAYNHLLQAAMTWLLRQDLRRPLVLSHVNLSMDESDQGAARLRFAAKLEGPAAKFFRDGGEWHVKLCGQEIPEERLQVSREGEQAYDLAGVAVNGLAGEQRCALEIVGNHPAFGSVEAKAAAAIPPRYRDRELGPAPQKLRQLAQWTGAELAFLGLDPSTGKAALESRRDPEAALLAWAEAAIGKDGTVAPSRLKVQRNFFWILDRPWFWLLLVGLPLEVFFRRRDELFGRSARN